MTSEEKAASYGHQLYRYRNHLRQARSEGKEKIIPKPVTVQEEGDAGAGASAAEAEAEPSSSELEEQVIKSVSNKMQKKAGLLLEHLKKTNVLKWNGDGEISYRGKMITDSNIVDLVANTM